MDETVEEKVLLEGDQDEDNFNIVDKWTMMDLRRSKAASAALLLLMAERKEELVISYCLPNVQVI